MEQEFPKSGRHNMQMGLGGRPFQAYDADIAFHPAEYQRPWGESQIAHAAGRLPGLPSEETRTAVNDLLARVRLAR